MDKAAQLSAAHCVLLAVHYASESNIDVLRTLTPSRLDAFEPELVLQILLTYLPESVEPAKYATYAGEVATRLYLEQRDTVAVDTSPVEGLTNTQAQKRVKKLHLLPLAHPSCFGEVAKEPLALFLIHRAHRIDAETGLLHFVPHLVVPFLDRSKYLRTWFLSTILPLLRLGFEYYPESSSTPSLDAFGQLGGSEGVEVLLSKCQEATGQGSTTENITARDLRGLVGPWMYGDSERKRRKLSTAPKPSALAASSSHKDNKRLSMYVDDEFKFNTDHDWEYVFVWLTETARHNFALVTEAIEEWDGPQDVDLGGYEERPQYLGEELQEELRLRYAQTAFAAVYAVEADTAETIEGAHSLLVRLATLMDFEPPPDLATSIDSLPSVDSHSSVLHETSSHVLQPDILLKPGHPLTAPKLETFSLLQIFVYSAYLLAGVGKNIAISNVAQLRFHSDEDEQFALLQSILHKLTTGPKKDASQWNLTRSRLIWLWNWGMDPDDVEAEFGAGVFGKVDRSIFEKEILKALLATSSFPLVTNIYLRDGDVTRLTKDEVESVILASAMNYYDNASNGNRNRGGMKKASDMISTFRQYFTGSSAFRRCEALLAATHALSFYSLRLQHGVPFQPVNIRVSKDPISLIGKVLDQNLHSYTKLDDLIDVAKNLVSAGLSDASHVQDGPMIKPSLGDLDREKRAAERRVMGMAIEAALHEDDFETAYSYVVNRLDPSSTIAAAPSTPSTRTHEDDDDSVWRAAFLAGRHRSNLSSSQNSKTGNAALRRLEQRIELLSQALLLAPPSALPEVLAVWRRCEEEMISLLAKETAEQERFDDRADSKIPGAFGDPALPVQARREVGRGAVEEAPMGLFDVARGAADAFRKSAFPLRGAAAKVDTGSRASLDQARPLSAAESETESIGAGSDGEQRVRRRDMVASAVTGSLASGLGWVLGATPQGQAQGGNR